MDINFKPRLTASSLFKSIFTTKKLKEIYTSSVKYSTPVGIDKINSKIFEKNLTKNIEIIKRKAHNGTYKFSIYREKLISRGANKFPRAISIPTIRDKVTLRAIFLILASLYKDETPFLHSIITGVMQEIWQRGFDSVIRLDVKDFYPSINHELLLKRLSKRIRKKELISLIKSAITQQTLEKIDNKKVTKAITSIPQGLPISNILANIYLEVIDKKYNNDSSLAYFRYVDDILIFCNRLNIEHLKQTIISDFLAIGLVIHGDDDPGKNYSGDASSRFNYLGYVFDGPLFTVRLESIQKLRESIIKTLTSYKYSTRPNNIGLLSWYLNLRITGCKFNGKNYGWMFYFSQINDLGLLASLDHFIAKQLDNFGINRQIIKVKKITRSFFEITKNSTNTNYIPDFDSFDIHQKKTILSNTFNIDTGQLNNVEINHQFRKKIFQSIKDLEKDLLRPS